MYIVHVYCYVKPDAIDEFKRITIENARNSDVIQQADDPARFVLVEVYRTPDDPARHRETAHYQAWAEAAPALLAEPRSKTIFNNVFPGEDGWDAR